MRWFLGRFIYAFEGLKVALSDRSVALQMLFGLIVLLAGFFFKLSVFEWLWVLMAIVLVIVSEIFNSCIERCVDYISLEHNSQAKAIKDLAALGVLCISGFALIVGLIIFLPKLF